MKGIGRGIGWFGRGGCVDMFVFYLGPAGITGSWEDLVLGLDRSFFGPAFACDVWALLGTT